MDKNEAIKIAKLYAKLIRQKYKNADVIMFGSYINGNYHNESDIDIAVVLNNFDNVMNIQLELMRLRRKIDSRIEPHPFRISDFNNTNPLANEILRYGVKINKQNLR